MRIGDFKRKSRVIVVDDNYEHLSGIKELIEIESDFDVVATATSASVAISLINSGYSLQYYQSDGKAEVDFVIQNRMGKIIPLEITTKSNSKAKSLSVFMNNYGIKDAIRITQDNFCVKKGIRYIPVYATFCLSEMI